MKLRKIPLYVLLGLLLVVTFARPAFVAAADSKKSDDKSDTSTQASAAAGVQGYAADGTLQIGTVVQLDGAGATKVKVAKITELNRMYGVVIDAHNLPITISNSSVQNETYVATAGTYNVLVSNQNGPIAVGDYVTLSAVDGVTMKADTEQAQVFGRAATAFAGKQDGIGTVPLKDTTGKANKTVTLGIISVAIDIKANPNKKSTKTNVPKVLQRIGEAVAEKPIGPLRMYLSIAITGISIVAAIVILYSGVRNSIVAIGRNPMAKKSIFRGLLEIVLTSIIILIIGLFAVYLLLKL